MNLFQKLCLSTVFINCAIGFSNYDVPSWTPHLSRRMQHTSSAAVAADPSLGNKKKINVQFLCNTTYISDEIRVTMSSSADIQETTNSFLEQLDASVVLLMANDKNPEPLVIQSIYDIPDPGEKEKILDQWICRANEYNDAVPPSGSSSSSSRNEQICDVATPAVSFPGFSVLSKIRLGVKYVQDKRNGVEYQFVQLSDTTEARGLRPLVWAHDKVTGKARTSDSGTQRARSFCTLRPIIRNDKEGRSGGSVRFEYKVYLEVQLEFSRVWVKVLPVPLEKVNGWGSAALTKTVEQNAPQNLQKLANAFETFLANQSKDR